MSIFEPVQESQVAQNTPLVLGASLAGLLLTSLIIKRPKPGPKLENHPMCGITTGGQEECGYNCSLSPDPRVSGIQIVRNPACLLDCGEQVHPCVKSLIRDVLSKGICYDPLNAGFEGVNISDSCVIADTGTYSIPVIVNGSGTCSPMTQKLFTQPECPRAIREQPRYIEFSIDYLLLDSCSFNVFIIYQDIIDGRRPECSYDCNFDLADPSFQLLVTNPACLLDCGEKIHPCVSSLVEDVMSKGMCTNTQGFEGVEISDDCEYDSEGDIAKGTCSTVTKTLVTQPGCATAVTEQPDYIADTINYLIRESCSCDVFKMYLSNILDQETSHHRGGLTSIRDHAKLAGNVRKNKSILRKSQLGTRLAPAVLVDDRENLPFRTVLNYEHTRHRYPWVCSLRTTGTSFQHLCAVTLLSIPPKPTVVVGPAHCTYLCKKNENTPVPSCCCAKGPAETCSADTNTCGDSPQVFLMTPDDATIVCGEWETGPVPSSLSGEEYNIILPIQNIVRHPNFTTNRGGGPIQGNDVAIFKTDDSKLQPNRRIRPACLPLEKRKSASGIHTGWSRPPPFHIVEQFAPGYLKFYRDFSKQWHYKMDIMDKCQDPQEFVGIPLSAPTNTYYPPATVCAKDFSRRSCFSQGDSGSPLMVREESRPQRFYAEGFLSFVKGCDGFGFGSYYSNSSWLLLQYSDNPAVYTKLSCYLPWIAREYGMEFEAGDVEEECVQGVGDPQDGDNESCMATTYQFGSNFLPSNITIDNNVCIFPFVYNGVEYDQCIVITIFDWVYLTRCPVRNLTTQFQTNGINTFTTEDAIFGVGGTTLNSDSEFTILNGYCPTDPTDPTSPLDPTLDNCDPTERRHPFGACNNNCPGVRAFGVIGGGAALAFAGGAAGLGLLGPVAGAGALGALGIAGSWGMCSVPFFCTARSGQCCLIVYSLGGPDCPDSC